MSQDRALSVSTRLLEKYSTTGPRYTSYPTAPVWDARYTPETHLQAIRETNAADNTRPISLYAHLPFCESRCLFCACNVVITRQRENAETYLGYLFKEIDRVNAAINTDRPIAQFHWGGGTPTFLSPDQMARLFHYQTERFQLLPEAEVAIEVDPRVTTYEQIDLLKDLGFNRISLGVQDFEPKVQEAVHRIQPREVTEEFTGYCRKRGFDSINFDLIYGLPHQTLETFEGTIADVIKMSPERIALYNYAHVPWKAGHQKAIAEEWLPGGAEKFRIFQRAIEAFTGAGYVYIGMDHFAKPTDELARALETGRLHRNFMGYTVKYDQGDPDLYAFGVSAISGLEHQYAQNVKTTAEYYRMIDAGRLPVERGYQLSDDDVLRRAVILDVLCQGVVDYGSVNRRFGIDFTARFAGALAAVQKTGADGLVEMRDEGFRLTPLGRIFSRNIAMPFDAYLADQMKRNEPTFSKTL